MPATNQILQFLLLLTTFLALIVGLSTNNRSKVPGSKQFAYLMFAISWWAFCDASQFWFDDLETKLLLAQLSYLGIIIAPLTWVSFIFTYSQIKLRIPAWLKWFVFVFCALYFLVVLSNSYHHLVYTHWDMAPEDYGLSFTYGPAFWGWVAVSYFCLMAGTIRLILTAIQSVTLLRANMILIIIGALFPWIGNILYITGLNPIKGFDPTPVGFTITGVIGVIIIFRKKLFNYVPLAYQNLFINLNDAALVVDYKGEIIEANKRARKLSKVKDLKHKEWIDFCRSLKENPEEAMTNYLDFEGDEGPEMEISLPDGGAFRWFMLQGNRIGKTEDTNRGYILSLRDITLWKKQKSTLEKSASLMGLSGRFAEEMLRSQNWREVYQEYAPNFRSICRATGCFLSGLDENNTLFHGLVNENAEYWEKTWKNYRLKEKLADSFHELIEINHEIFVVLPIEVNETILGHWVFYWSSNEKTEALEAIDVLKLASNVLSSSIENQQHEEQLLKAKDEA
ncbi:MAG: PAS domain S-box protein, partial [Bacteroidota bacterium]|nr:PAS domain S-box protein [Bacteroidota bacterium]MDX5431260.1 PAS domain S-box protein [Bacteroidota bacterium]MDX5469999.1 PAS domain S-box protein [Bacteroidota bacterium]